jgi:hypothetical protein
VTKPKSRRDRILMAAAHNSAFAQAVGIPQDKAREQVCAMFGCSEAEDPWDDYQAKRTDWDRGFLDGYVDSFARARRGRR